MGKAASRILRGLFSRHLLSFNIGLLISNTFGMMIWSVSVLYALNLKATILEVNLITAVS